MQYWARSKNAAIEQRGSSYGADCIFLLAASLASQAQERGAGVQANTVCVSAQGTFESQPDTAILQFSISAQDKTARAA